MAPEWQRQRGRLGSTYLIAHLSLGVLHPLNLMKHSFLSIPFPLPSTKTYHLPSRISTYSHFVNNFLLSTNCNIMITKGISLKQMGLYNHTFFCLFVFNIWQRRGLLHHCFFLKSLLNLLQYCFCCLCSVDWEAYRFSAPQGGIEPAPGCTGRWGLNRWTTREVPLLPYLRSLLTHCVAHSVESNLCKLAYRISVMGSLFPQICHSITSNLLLSTMKFPVVIRPFLSSHVCSFCVLCLWGPADLFISPLPFTV